MTKTNFNNLNRGDQVKHKGDGNYYIVTANYGDRITAVKTVDLTNPSEWDLVCKATHTYINDER